ncbi:predicted protein [Histoplasma capsulatum H143]|uniref:Uncharacterized protein n=1 Tax=Ajellomyces capsulatus (strain H143) TaxID=544712 RepID=C6HPF3_AJECH|nr:predicted protein [Histoplasma capsulatum H143]
METPSSEEAISSESDLLPTSTIFTELISHSDILTFTRELDCSIISQQASDQEFSSETTVLFFSIQQTALEAIFTKVLSCLKQHEQRVNENSINRESLSVALVQIITVY